MPSVTHPAIVSTSGFTGPAIKKAKHHGVDLYAIDEWTKPLEEQFPHLAPMKGSPAEHIRGVNFQLVWADAQFWLNIAGPGFKIRSDSELFDADREIHALYGDFRTYMDAMMVRSTALLWGLPPIQGLVMPLVNARFSLAQMPEEPQWPYDAHTRRSP